jgi:hypothetical protein
MTRRFVACASTAVLAAVVASPLAGCAPGSLAAEGAGQGAKSGAIGGAVAGAVGSLFWGGNVLENMVAGAVVTAAAGAAVGGAAGASQDKAIEDQRTQSERDAALQQRLGPDNFAAAQELALCKHKTAIGKARTAYGRAADDERKRYALMIEAIANRELENTEAEQKTYPLLLPLYGAGATAAQIEADVAKAEGLVQDVREAHGASRTCE